MNINVDLNTSKKDFRFTNDMVTIIIANLAEIFSEDPIYETLEDFKKYLTQVLNANYLSESTKLYIQKCNENLGIYDLNPRAVIKNLKKMNLL